MPIDETRLRHLLERLEEHWWRQGADIARALQGGLTDGEIDALMAPLGIRLPDELRIWWGWHNGTEPLDTIGPGGWDFVPLQRAIEYYHGWLDYGAESVAPDIPAMAEAYWHVPWFPIVSLGGPNIVLYVDTAEAQPGDTVPVKLLDATIWENYLGNRVPSFTDAVQLWIDALDNGYHWWSSDYGGSWQHRYAEIPLELRQTGIV